MTAGPPTAQLLEDPTLVGTGLSTAWTNVIDEWLSAIVAGVDEVRGVVLAAVGGYGRGELSPCSDLDLLLLHDGSGAVAEVAERVWYPVWDSGMKLGHAVRTIDEALDLATDDLETATSLLDMRWLGGDHRLLAELAERSQRLWVERADTMLPMIAESARERHLRCGEIAFLLEPDLKASRGGLRDVHSLRWMQRADSSLLTASESAALSGPHDTLLAARVELHRRVGRPNDVLLLQEQDEVAPALGYHDADELMADVAAAGRSVAWIEDAVLHRLHARGIRRRFRSKPVVYGHGIEVLDDTLNLTDDAEIAKDPVLPLRVALVAAREDAFVRRDVLDRLAAQSPSLPNPWPDEAREVLVDLLLTGGDAIRVLEALDQVDLISRIFPEWTPNRSRPQRNAYHRFTVDRHLFETAAEAAAIADRVERPDLLVLGALFHDIGKGYPGDHSVVGVELVRSIGRRMGYPPSDVDVLASLVRHHLLLPDVASRRDLDDPGTIRFVAEVAGSVGTIELLAALTEADSIATGPAAWGVWKADLVHELAHRSCRFLREGDPGERSETFPSEHHLELLAAGEVVVSLDGHELTTVTFDRPGMFARVAGALALNGVEILGGNVFTAEGMALQVMRLAGGVGIEEHPERVTRDVEAALAGRMALRARLLERARTYRFQRTTTARPAVPQVVFDNETSAVATVIEVRAPDSIGLLYRVTRALADLDLDITGAKVQTLGDDVVDTFYVAPPEGGKVLDPTYLAEIELAVMTAIGAYA